jgi:hypothetical protein
MGGGRFNRRGGKQRLGHRTRGDPQNGDQEWEDKLAQTGFAHLNPLHIDRAKF